jgi:hypothetical protein
LERPSIPKLIDKNLHVNTHAIFSFLPYIILLLHIF